MEAGKRANSEMVKVTEWNFPSVRPWGDNAHFLLSNFSFLSDAQCINNMMRWGWGWRLSWGLELRVGEKKIPLSETRRSRVFVQIFIAIIFIVCGTSSRISDFALECSKPYINLISHWLLLLLSTTIPRNNSSLSTAY